MSAAIKIQFVHCSVRISWLSAHRTFAATRGRQNTLCRTEDLETMPNLGVIVRNYFMRVFVFVCEM